jgi:hypothetical protein
MSLKRLLILLAVSICALAFSSAAFANALTCAHGAGSCGQVSGGQGTSGGGTLPFTGLNLGAIAAVAAILLVSGVVLFQRSSRRGQ